MASYLSDKLGLMHLCSLHTKLLTEEETSSSKEAKNAAVVTFQITSCLRNLCNLGENCVKLITHLDGLKLLEKLVEVFPKDVDVMCNVARLLSVLTASYEELFDQHAQPGDMIRILYVILSRHHPRRDIVVRVTFVLGNLAARRSEARLAIGMHCDTVSLLPLLLRQYISEASRESRGNATLPHHLDEASQDFGSTGNSEDTAIKIIRVFANASIESETVRTNVGNKSAAYHHFSQK